ncbi:relaxase/mobilization nuclease domain-containing protein [Streptomyces sp. MBT65]|uniref:relaxase/mobilization nuclease domain-containing protein n=1 Tax=Streptomyces sp. MBT65 TaxID=1488395 RepID=UPI00190A0A56|nr:relaxase/mobilization nuclease domain-containing protein [Streptomyces sp. MBT65]MBK3573870.1 relaxase/mobilization nuclease domain-containing protein [Streptomyces sp. MBT65]
MIANIVKPGNHTYGVLAYLFDKGRANEHTDQHIVASWDDFVPDPGPWDTPGHKQRLGQLTQALDLRVKQAGDKAPEGHVWHCSIRAAPQDHILTDAEWATIARRVLHATGIAPDSDPDGCRWVAVRHAEDHIHIVATKVRGDLRPPRNWNDYHRAMNELRAVEEDFGLTQVPHGPEAAAGTSAVKRSTRAEEEKAKRQGHDKTARERLRHAVRTALSHAKDLNEFFNLLADAGLQVETRTLPSGDLQGYKVALADAGTTVWFSGSSLATDLSLPQIRQRLAAAEAQPTAASSARPHRPSPWHVATAAAERIPHHLTRADDGAIQAHLTVFGEVLYALPAHAPVRLQAELHRAAVAFEHAAHTRARADHQHARALRGALKAMRYQPADHTGLAMFLDAAVLVVLAVQRHSALHHHDRQVAAARQTLTHLQAAYAQIAPASLAALARHSPSDSTVHRYALTLHEVLPRHAEQILTEGDWPALIATLAAVEAAGHNPATVLQQAAQHRPLDDAKSVSEVLVWRVQRLGDRHVSSSRRWGALDRTPRVSSNARTTTAAPSTSTPLPPRVHRSR